MTDREKAIVMAYTGFTMLIGDKLDIFYQYIREKLGYCVMTHELAFPEVQAAITDAAKNDFIELCATVDAVPVREHEPRVMTLEELKNSLDYPCWFESHGTYMGEKGFWIIPYMFSVTGMMSYVFPLMQTDERGNTHYSELGTYVYGKVWRCWTSRPIDEQREATQWEK